MAPWWRLSPRQLDQVWESLELTGYPFPFEVRNHGETLEERLAIRTQVAAELSTMGLLRDGQLDPGLEDALRAIARPMLWFDSVWLPDNETESPFRLISVPQQHGTLLALQFPGEAAHYGGPLHIEHLPRVDPVRALIERLPAGRPGDRPAVAVPVEPALARSSRTSADFSVLSEIHTTDHASRDRRAFDELMSLPRTRGGQIAANTRDRAGRHHRSPVVRWFDVDPDQRYMITTRTELHGVEWVSVAPADPNALHSHIDGLLRSVPGQGN
ncbi:ESX secretion-associated protein EspG [Longimycelium tulufanense]|uniref:ESX secretion-associated protein EspG n=1 Tax=Longimycelium tulufanense TaxID=907463 RepID=A0A8J3C748_9PSEU|nr:ESX secretion-associated protein EspG [Longimycelium tulufanense]GGM32712.1 ESX secretion-associated protein EspG [Longimycelium tulufanense]